MTAAGNGTARQAEPIDVELRVAAGAISEARAVVDRMSGDEALLNNLRLLVSEIVTNSVRHAGLDDGSRISLHIEASPELVRVEVTDPGPGFVPRVPELRISQDSGWGLYLVDELADRWGVDAGDGTRVWFEIDR
jgi:anti-sigma regulatory factor (Ser/Thr protein kinase)